METWKFHFPDYEIRKWKNDDIANISNRYVQQAFAAKKWAFVSDYVRLYALYHYGGIYMDTDVAVIRNFDRFLNDQVFLCFEGTEHISIGTLGAVKEQPWIKKILDAYEDRKFIKDDGAYDYETNVQFVTRLSKEDGLVLNGQEQLLQNGVHIYPSETFIGFDLKRFRPRITINTHAVHEYDGSWVPKKVKKGFFRKMRYKIKDLLEISKKKIVELRN